MARRQFLGFYASMHLLSLPGDKQGKQDVSTQNHPRTHTPKHPFGQAPHAPYAF